MNSLERVLGAVGHQPVDRTPVCPVLLMQGAQVLGVQLKDYFGHPARIAEGQLALLDRFGHDAVFAIPHIVQDVLPWGAKIAIHSSGPPSLAGMALRNGEDILDRRVPDPADHEYTRCTLDAAAALAGRVKGQVPIVGALIGPFSLPTMLMGTKKFLELLLDQPGDGTYDRVYGTLIDKMVEYTVRWAKRLFDAGCDLVVFAEGIASASILDATLFERYARPVLERFVSEAGGLLALELVGFATPCLPSLRSLDVVAYLLGEEDDLGEARRAIGPGRALMGNLNNIKLMRWTAERVEFEARRLIRRRDPGLILSNQGPEVPWHTPHENIRAMIRAAESTRSRSTLGSGAMGRGRGQV